MRVLVTGASGFVGSALLPNLRQAGFETRAAYRSFPPGPDAQDRIAVGEMDGSADWRRALSGCDAVVHLAGPAHRRCAESEYRRVIVDGARTLAAQAAEAGVKRFVFLSSIKASADVSDKPLTEADPPSPTDAYGRAKLDAEREVLAQSDIGPVALRPPLIVGAGAKANLNALLQLAAAPAPLPFASIDNARSFIALDTLCAAIARVLEAESAPPAVFHIADRPALSSAEVVRAMRRGFSQSELLFSAPCLRGLLPKALTQNLVVDDSAFRAAFGYGPLPARDMRDAFAACAQAWKQGR